MEKIIKTLTQLKNSKRILAAEQTIMTTVSHLDQYCVPGISEEKIKFISDTLLNLYSINDGAFSIQCSCYIASKLVKIYVLSRNPHLWDLFNMTICKTNTSTIMASGYVAHRIGEKFTSQLPRLVEHLLKQNRTLDFSVAYCLRECFYASKNKPKTLEPYINQVFDFCSKALQNSRQNTIITCIRLLKTMIKYPSVDVYHVVSMAQLILKEEQYPFIKNQVASLVAKCAAYPLLLEVGMPKSFSNSKPRDQQSESHEQFGEQMENTEGENNTDDQWKIGGNQTDTKDHLMQDSLTILQSIPDILPLSLPHFYSYLNSELLSQTIFYEPLFKFAQNTPSSLPALIPILPSEARFSYFHSFSKAKISANQMHMLDILSPDENSITEAAGVALLLCSSDESDGRHSGLDFFAKFSQTHPTLVLSYLRTAIVFLAIPPLPYPKIQEDMRGNAQLAYIILSNLPKENFENALTLNDSTLCQFISSALSHHSFTDMHSPRFIGAIKLLSILPNKYTTIPNVLEAITQIISFLRDMNEKIFSESLQDQKFFMKMLKLVLAYEVNHLDATHLNIAANIAISQSNSHITLSFSTLMSLEESIPVTAAGTTLAFQVAKIILNTLIQAKIPYNLSKLFITRVLPTGMDLLSVHCLPESFENVSSINKNSENSDNSQNEKEVLLSKVEKRIKLLIEGFPTLLLCCAPNDRSNLLNSLISNLKTTSCLLLSVEIAKIASTAVPQNFFSSLIALLKSDSLLVLQLASEAISYYAAFRNDMIPIILKWIEKNNNPPSYILLSSLFMHAKLLPKHISFAIVYLDQAMRNGKIIPYAIHALISALLTHSMEMESLELTGNQFNEIFNILNTPISMQPSTLYLCSTAITLLIEICTSDLSTSIYLTSILRLILKTIQLTPISFAKKTYFDICKSLFIFSPSFKIYDVPVFPKNTHEESVILSACDVFGLNQTINLSSINVSELLPMLLILLQKTGDKRCSHFIEVLSDAKHDEQSIKLWVGTVRRIVLISSLLEGSTTIEPSTDVKECMLKVSYRLLQPLSTMITLKTTLFDDIISAACHALESSRLRLEKAAFPVLEQSINLFKDRKTEEGDKLLDIHESQLNGAAVIGFSVGLSISGKFLLAFLASHQFSLTEQNDEQIISKVIEQDTNQSPDFDDSKESDSSESSDDSEKDQKHQKSGNENKELNSKSKIDYLDESPSENIVLSTYLTGLSNCGERTSIYFELATNLCTAIFKNFKNDLSKIGEKEQSFLISIEPAFAEIIISAMKIKPNDWRMLSSFRKTTQSFYSELLFSYILLQSIESFQKNPAIPYDVLFAFLLCQATNAVENWLKEAALNAIPIAISSFGKLLSGQLLEQALLTKLNIEKPKDDNEFDNFAHFSIESKSLSNSKNHEEISIEQACSELLRPTNDFDKLRLILLSRIENQNINKATVIAYLLTSDERKILRNYIPYITDIIIKEMVKQNSQIDSKQGEALFSLLLEHSPMLSGFYIEKILELPNDRFIEFKDFSIFSILTSPEIIKLNNSVPFEKLLRFCIETFTRGGMQLVGSIISQRKDLGLAFFAKGIGKAAFLLASNDLNNSRIYLSFIKHVYEIDGKQNVRMSASIFKLCAKIIRTFGKDVQRGPNLVLLCVQIIIEIKEEISDKDMKLLWESIPYSEKEEIINMLKSHISKAEIRKKSSFLTAFSTNMRSERSISEWQDLEIGDD